MKLTLQQAAQQALQVQDACNFSGVLNSLNEIMQNTLMPQSKGSRWAASHPITVLFMLKLAELGGWDSTLNPAYWPAERACMELASLAPTNAEDGEIEVDSAEEC